MTEAGQEDDAALFSERERPATWRVTVKAAVQEGPVDRDQVEKAVTDQLELLLGPDPEAPGAGGDADAAADLALGSMEWSFDLTSGPGKVLAAVAGRLTEATSDDSWSTRLVDAATMLACMSLYQGVPSVWSMLSAMADAIQEQVGLSEAEYRNPTLDVDYGPSGKRMAQARLNLDRLATTVVGLDEVYRSALHLGLVRDVKK